MPHLCRRKDPLVEAQNTLLEGIKPEDLAGEGDDKQAEQARELEEAIKKITDENKKQAADLEKLMAEVDKAAKGGGDGQ